MKKFAIDLTSLSKIDGGYGYYTRNLLDGLMCLDIPYVLYLIVGKDNYQLFEKYNDDPRMIIVKTDCISASKKKRLIWVNLKLGKLLKTMGISNCIEPYYCMPIFNIRGIKFYTAIHDLQALHYPEFQSGKQILWLRFMWQAVSKKAHVILTISNFSKDDIESHFKRAVGKVHTVYIAVSAERAPNTVFEQLSEKYSITDKNYYYSVSKLRKNKNFGILVETFYKMKQQGRKLPMLLVSGSNGGDGELLKSKLLEYGLQDNIVLTGFVSDIERNALYEHAKAFLFPSVFEGFGMTPIEAMSLGTPVITTKCTSLYEVTQGKANYVDDPLNVDEWLSKIDNFDNRSSELDCKMYTPVYFANEILSLIEDMK